MRNYKGIEFAEGYNKTFAEFKEEFGTTHIFANMFPEEREVQLKKSHKIAMSKDQGNLDAESISNIDVIDEKIVKQYGHTSGSVTESKKNNTKEPGE